jgi:hypothetical protein
MRRNRRALIAVWSILTVAGVTVTGVVASAPASAASKQKALSGALLGVSCTSATSCMGVGSAGGPNLSAGLRADQWDGVTWSVVPVPKPPHAVGEGDLTSVACTSPSACMAVGNYATKNVFKPLAESWNGTAWSFVPMPQGGFAAPDLIGVSCATASSCAAVGCEVNGDFCAATVAYEWNGTAWRPERTPASGRQLSSVSCTAPSSCMAVGTGTKGTLAERWNGRAWSIVPSPNPKNRGFLELDGVSCLAAGCEAVGSYASFGPGDLVTLAEHWDGHAWSIQKFPNPPGALVGLGGVSCSAASACTAVGNYDNNTGQTYGTAMRWNGTAWSLQAPAHPHTTPFVTVTLAAVSCPAAAACTTVGYNVFGAEGASRALAEGWNGTSWAIEPTLAPAG